MTTEKIVRAAESPGPPRDDLLAALERLHPERVAFQDGDGEATCGQARDQVYRMARALAARKLCDGQVIACVLPISTNAILLGLAINHAGCGYMTLPTDIPVDVQVDLISEAEAAAVVVDPAAGGNDILRLLSGTHPSQFFTFGPGGVGEDLLSLAARESPLPFESAATPDGLSTFALTGGTTGRPKIVVRRFDSVTPRRLGQPALPRAEQPVRLLKCKTMSSPALRRFAESTLFSGGTVITQKDFDPAAVIATIEQQRVTHLVVVPPQQLRAIVDHPLLASTDTSSLRWVFCTATRVSVSLLRRAVERLGPVIYHGYGLTEANGISRLSPEDYFPDHLELLATCGKALTGVEIAVRDSAGNAVAASERGDLWVRTPYVMTGYLNRPDLVSHVLRDGWLRTEDVGSLDEDGFLTMLGRATDALNTTGDRIFFSEIERCIEEHPGVLECAAFTIPGPHCTQTLHVAVVSETASQIDENKLRKAVHHRLGPAGVPQSVQFVPRIPLNHGDIPNRALLARLVSHRPPGS
ncbi:MAG TPA: AMP-binding protein [Pseudonocardiaceae bacterium]